MGDSSPERSPMPKLKDPVAMEAPKESALSRLLITPITFLTFILTLFLIDSRNHYHRTATHQAPTTLLGRARNFLHQLVFKEAETSPYASVKSPAISATTEGADKGSGKKGKEGEKEPWHWHTKQRQMMKAEVDDAFKLRKWVLLTLVVGWVGLTACVYSVLGIFWRWLT